MYVHIVETVTVRPVMKSTMMQHVTIDNFTARRFAMNVMEKYLLTDDKMVGCEGFALSGLALTSTGITIAERLVDAVACLASHARAAKLSALRQRGVLCRLRLRLVPSLLPQRVLRNLWFPIPVRRAISTLMVRSC